MASGKLTIVKAGDNAHYSKNTGWVDSADAVVEVSHIAYLMPLGHAKVYLASAIDRATKSGGDLPVSALEVFNAIKRQHRLLLVAFGEGRTIPQPSQKSVIAAEAQLVSIGYDKPIKSTGVTTTP